jgi:rifampicin phosphotransferase
MSTHWIVEGQVDPRWPINTRGNIGEVFPEVWTPLSYKLAVIPAEQGWRDAFTTMGILAANDLRRPDPTIIGLYGGYGYLDLSFLRIVGVRAPGSNPVAPRSCGRARPGSLGSISRHGWPKSRPTPVSMPSSR